MTEKMRLNDEQIEELARAWVEADRATDFATGPVAEAYVLGKTEVIERMCDADTIARFKKKLREIYPT